MLFMTVLPRSRRQRTPSGRLSRHPPPLQASSSPSRLPSRRRLASRHVATGLAALGLAAARLALDLPIANWTAAVSFVLAGAAVWNLVMLNVQILAGAKTAARSSPLRHLPSMMLGGAMFPFAMMPTQSQPSARPPLGWDDLRFDSILRGHTATSVAPGSPSSPAITLLFGFMAGI
jgi:hypothetical protein